MCKCVAHQNVASHSVGHFVDMNDSTIVPTGAPGNTKTNYHPHNNGGATIGATCWGEMETSKNILQTDIGITNLSETIARFVPIAINASLTDDQVLGTECRATLVVILVTKSMQ